MKKEILLLSLYCCIAQACTSQQNEKLSDIEINKIMKETYNSLHNTDTSIPHLTTDNYITTMASLVQEYNYDAEPAYYVFIDRNDCAYEILVNDMPVFSTFMGERWSTPFYLNAKILKSGKQNFTYRLYPLHKTMGDSTVFGDETSFSVRIYKRDNRTSFRDEQLILEHKAQIRKDSTWVFPSIGKNYYENTITFNAQVPYELKGWSDGQDLTKFNRKKLEEEVLRFYHKQWLILRDKDIEAWFSYIYRREVEIAKSFYPKNEDYFTLNKEEILNNRINLEILNLHLFENYEIKFYGNNKVVSLILNHSDPNFNGRSALYFDYKRGQKKAKMSITIYLYLPEGRELKADNFIIIR